jgi:hypothetical protein
LVGSFRARGHANGKVAVDGKRHFFFKTASSPCVAG